MDTKRKIIDISMPIRDGMVTWADKEPFSRDEQKSNDSIISRLDIGSHTGTHIDAPKHFLGESAPGVDDIDTRKLIGQCKVFQVNEKIITADILKPLDIGQHDKIIFLTKNTSMNLLDETKFTKEYVSLDVSGAEYLVEKEVDLVGIDYLGIEAKGNPGHPVHKTLLAAGVVIVEGLYLKGVKPGEYELAILPLKIKAGDGSPARAVLTL